GTSINGSFEDSDGGLNLYYGLNSIFGSLWANGKAYAIQGATNDGIVTIRLVEAIDVVDLTDDAISLPKTPKQGKIENLNTSKLIPVANAVDPTLDYLVLYDPSMVVSYGWGLVDHAATKILLLNQAFEVSDIPLNASIADMKFMNPDPMFSQSDILFAISGEDGEFSGIQNARERLGADIISANIAGGGGLAFVNDPSLPDGLMIHTIGNNNIFFDAMVLAHETGHNLGLAHDIFGNGVNRRTIDDNCGTPECWAGGYMQRDPLTGEIIYQSIMNPNGTGLAQSGSVLSFSNPGTNCKKRRDCPRGVPMEGIVGRPNSGADAARSLRTYVAGNEGNGNSTAGVPNQRLLTAMLPTSRFVTRGEAVTAFMTVFNPNTIVAEECKIQHHGPDHDTFSYQVTDPATNAPVGTANTPVDIPAGAFQTFLISLTPSVDIADIVFAPFASCANAPMSAVTEGLNTLSLGADLMGGPDLIALSATLNNDGIVEVPDGNFGVFSVATINIGGAGNTVVSANSLDPTLPATALVCQTDSAGACMENPSQSVSVFIDANGTPTFGVFVQTAFSTSFAPGKRFQFEMRVDGNLRGATSIALRDMAPLAAPQMNEQNFAVNVTKTHSGALADLSSGFVTGFEIIMQPSKGTVTLDLLTGVFTYTAGISIGTDSFTYRALNSGGVSNTATASININALPLPTTQNASFEDDVDGLFQVDLDTLSNGDIDQFALVSAPAGSTLDPVSGFLEVPLASAPGSVDVQFAAINASGQSTTGTITVNTVAFDACMPLRATKFRILRRLTAIETDNTGLINLDEGLVLLDSMCLPPPDQLDTHFAGSFDTVRLLFFAFDLQTFAGGWDIERYSVTIQDAPAIALLGSIDFQLCKETGNATFFECPLK
ncbi:MAG: zinc-dependent metalloprotease, partial [Robiginitomaculum sp.]|nr:zinc-dependent metalloprotease [Robiginitomaculum sp.]